MERRTGPKRRWSAATARAWAEVGRRIRGCNYLPATAINPTEMWQGDTFDPLTIDRELRWTADLGLNSVRVFLPFAVWQHDGPGLVSTIERFLTIADRHGVTAMPVLFDDVAFAGRDPYLGPQDGPAAGVHNSGWTPSPGRELIADSARWGELEAYVVAVIGSFATDGRIVAWDIYNEPGNFGVGALPVDPRECGADPSP